MLIKNWKRILTKAWSVRFLGLAAFCEIGRHGLTEMAPWLPISEFWVSVGTTACIAGALVSRFIHQSGVSDAEDRKP